MSSDREELIAVGLGEMKVMIGGQSTLACLGLGSCVGIAAYDPSSGVAGMAHFVLPEDDGRTIPGGRAKFVDTGLARLLEAMIKKGAMKSRLVVKLAGGARMALAGANDVIFKIGERNAAAAKEALRGEGMRLAASDLGGSHGRTLRMNVETGEVTISVAGSGPTKL